MPPKSDSLKTLATIVQVLQKSQPGENPLAHIVTMVRQETHVDVCSLYLLEEKTLIMVATDGLDPASIGKVRMGIHEGLTGLAVEKNQPVIVYEASQHPRFKYFPETGEERFSSFVAIPLMEREKVVGVLALQTKDPRTFDHHEVELLKLIAFQLSGVIRNLVTLEVLQMGREKEKKPIHLQGMAVAPGFGIGPAFFIRAGVSPVILSLAEQQNIDPQEEWKKLNQAIHKTEQELLKLEKKIEKKFSKSEADIFYSHRMILTDKSFLKKLQASIHKGALTAIKEVVEEYISEFEKIEVPHIRERAADLEDIRERILENLLGSKTKRESEKWEGILIAETLTPTDTTRLDPERIGGIVASRGGATSHAAILARSLGIPAIMGVTGITSKIQPGDLVIVDGTSGHVYVNPEKNVLQEYERIQERYADQIVHLQKLSEVPAQTKEGRRIRLEANVGLFSGMNQIHVIGAEGVGLYRTEFPFMVRKKLPDEEDQLQIYSKIMDESKGLPVTFRLLDAGGDKPIESLGVIKEANPFLGYRSIRLSLSRPELLRVQLRALLRVSALGPLKILVPMISSVDEIRAVKHIYNEVRRDLNREGVPFDESVPLGIMIEVPSAVWISHLLIKECDFFSIGTNDLTQYTLAVDRNNERVAQFFEPLHPAVLASIGHVARVGQEAAKPVSVCGEMAGDPRITPLFVGLGITSLSMIPSSLPLVKNVILQLEYEKVKKLAKRALTAATVTEVQEMLDQFQKQVTVY